MKNLFTELRDANVATVEVEYQGSGDEGWIEEVTLQASDNTVLENKKITEMVEEFVYDKLPGGWEINEGSYGTVTINVATREAKFDHMWYVISTEGEPFSVSGDDL